MQQPTSQILYAYWNNVRGKRIAPKRFEIEPARIAAILPETFILERIGPENYRFRLAGTRICEQFCRELRGTNFIDLWAGDDIASVTDQLTVLGRTGGVGLLQFTAETQLGSRARFEAILLPLLHTQQTITRYLGAISTSERPGWLGAEHLVRQRLLSHDIIWPDGRAHTIAPTSEPAPFKVGEHTASRIVSVNRRHFRVYEGGRAKMHREDG